MKNDKIRKLVMSVISALNIISIVVYTYDSEKYSILFFVIGVLTILLMILILMTDKNTVKVFKESEDGTYSKSDQSKLSLFFCIIFLVLAWFMPPPLKYLFLVAAAVFGYTTYKFRKDD